MTRFRMDNTEGYNQAELDALNEAFEEVMNNTYDPAQQAAGYYDSIEYKSWQDHVAETLLARFDAGESLVW
jgi:hypothetical protein